MSKEDWDNFIEECGNYSDYDLSIYKSDGVMPPVAMPKVVLAETPKFSR